MKEIPLNRTISVLLAVAVCAAAAGCASQPAGDGDRAAIPTGSGVTVFGTIDAGVSRTKSN
jgi:hypothetical protein